MSAIFSQLYRDSRYLLQIVMNSTLMTNFRHDKVNIFSTEGIKHIRFYQRTDKLKSSTNDKKHTACHSSFKKATCRLLYFCYLFLNSHFQLQSLRMWFSPNKACINQPDLPAGMNKDSVLKTSSSSYQNTQAYGIIFCSLVN